MLLAGRLAALEFCPCADFNTEKARATASADSTNKPIFFFIGVHPFS
jgi:hypothetical protein